MKKNLLYFFTALSLLFLSQVSFAQRSAVNQNTSQTTAVAPDLLTTVCYALFTASGEITNVNNTTVFGDIGTNLGTTTGFDPLNVTGEIHLSPDVSTGICASDVNTVYNELNAMPFDTQLANPTTFGNEMILNAQAYFLNAATILTGNLYLDAQGNSDAVFIFHITGAFSTVINAQVILTNGAQAKNVFWKVVGAVDIAANTHFAGTIVSKDGAISLGNASTLEGRALTTNGAVNTNAATVTMTPGCSTVTADVSEKTVTKNKVSVFCPNVSNTSLVITLKEVSSVYPTGIKLYNTIGKLVLNKVLSDQKTVLQINFTTGVYFYHLTRSNVNIESGKLILN